MSSSTHYADLAASVHLCTEELILHIVAKASEIAGTRDVCLAGGVALNSLANGRLIRERGYNLFVHPRPEMPATPSAPQQATITAPPSSRACRLLPRHISARRSMRRKSRRHLPKSGFDAVRLVRATRSSPSNVAGLLRGCAVIGWVQGQAEWGRVRLVPAAILADATNPA